jgi:transcription initiation factor TFIIIB Brf1 subunit/transcription initiation factor TFIIB
MCGNMRAALLQHKTLQGPSLTKINKTAEQLLQRLLEAKRTKGRPRAVLQAATLYAACRINGFPVTLDMLAGRFNVSRKALARAYRMMTYEFKGGQLLQKDLAKFFGISELGIRLSTEVLQPLIDNGGP